MENETERGDSREREVNELRNDAAFLEGEVVGIGAAAAVLEVEADELEADRREIHFKVDGEPYETFDRALTPNQILRVADLDPTLRYLEEISPEKVSFKDKGEDVIRMINRMEFISLRVGPTPVS